MLLPAMLMFQGAIVNVEKVLESSIRAMRKLRTLDAVEASTILRDHSLEEMEEYHVPKSSSEEYARDWEHRCAAGVRCEL